AATPYPQYVFYANATSFAWSTWGTGVASNPSLWSRVLAVGTQLPPGGDAVAKAVCDYAVAEYNTKIPGGMAPTGSLFFSQPGSAFNTSTPARLAYDGTHMILLATVGASVVENGGPVLGTDIAATLKTFAPPAPSEALDGPPPSDPFTIL